MIWSPRVDRALWYWEEWKNIGLSRQDQRHKFSGELCKEDGAISLMKLGSRSTRNAKFWFLVKFNDLGGGNIREVDRRLGGIGGDDRNWPRRVYTCTCTLGFEFGSGLRCWRRSWVILVCWLEAYSGDLSSLLEANFKQIRGKILLSGL